MNLDDRPHWLPWSAFPFQTRYADVADQRIHYLDEGSGPTLLLVSAGQWSFMFRDVIMRLRGQFRCLTLDFPGCGLSPDAAAHDHSVRANADILEGFIDALDLQSVTMVVHDIGGPLGFLIATRRPQRFRALVISNTFGWPLAAYPVHRQPLRRRAAPDQGRPAGVPWPVALGQQPPRDPADPRRGAAHRPDDGRGGAVSSGRARRSARAHAVRAQKRSQRLAGPVRPDLPPRGGRGNRRRAPFPVQRRPGWLRRRDLRLVDGEVATAPGQSTNF